MKLFYAPYSPYVRHVRVVAHELGLDSAIELIDSDTWNPPKSLLSSNGLQKIPTLVTDDDLVIHDSRVITRFLCSMSEETPLVPRERSEKWRTLTRESIGIGLMDLMVERFVEFARPENLRSEDWIDRLNNKTGTTHDAIAGQLPLDGDQPDLGSIAIACALGYSDFRFPGINWRLNRPGLTAWYEKIVCRPSFVSTEPADWAKTE